MANALPRPDGGQVYAAAVLARYARSRARRDRWRSLWRDCYALVLPYRSELEGGDHAGDGRGDRVFDGTAPDAVDQLAASLLAQLTPPWSRWVGLVPGTDYAMAERAEARALLAAETERMTATLHAHLDRSNFAVEIHQCFLDLVVGGTATLLVEEAPPGEVSALRFAAVPLAQTVLDEGPRGRLDTAYRRIELTRAEAEDRFPGLVPGAGQANASGDASSDAPGRITLVEAVEPVPAVAGGGYRYLLILPGEGGEGDGEPVVLGQARLAESPFVSFRWMKAPGEVYGRSPVMKALPDIRTANRVVELVLKNASIAVTGIWQADDDGVLNPATVRLVPGAIIPKAVGSSGLRPLEAPGNFDVSQLVLDDLRGRIRHALLADQLAQVNAPRMTATEVLERTAQMARLLGATYGRLQSELLTPLVLRCLSILRRRGEIPDLVVDGRTLQVQFRGPLAQAQAQRDVQSTLHWLEAANTLGADAVSVIDATAAVRWLADRFGVAAELVRAVPPPTEMEDGDA
ncbi:MAG: head-tail connector protein [Rhodospirillaceae bacterium]|nr:head-tail connector protein [Rhodospirillaceae bacterium]